MIEYVCLSCDAAFEMWKYTTEARCPECLEWDAVPVDDYEEGVPLAPYGEEVLSV